MNTQTPDLFNQPDFSMTSFAGSNYEPEKDKKRLTGQISDIYNLMKDGVFRSLRDIEESTGYPQASISAQLRNMRKEPFKMIIHKERWSENGGTWKYKLIL